MPKRRRVYLRRASISYRRPVATLLRHNGTEFPGGVIANKIKIPHEYSTVQVTERANNSIAFTEMGDRRGRTAGFIVEVFDERAVAAIMAEIGRSGTDGVFRLERPPLNRRGRAWRHFIRFFRDSITDFEMVTDARSTQRIQWHRATVSNAEVLRTVRF